ncbi:hypothetical protein DFH08DRAFT_819309 [Mycena albidolilacea]|uniref:Uncharacterized protein n=1 Tax=Mycena albidolilacea TaxID=1033008 RepID=A0AAD7EFR9_9AGAR|nr:hypothetical protein DFH08DRAFT_819309 [Mycena albidolilacea]
MAHGLGSLGPSTAGPTESPADKGNGRTVPSSAISPVLCASRRTALASYQPKESDPDDEKKTGYVPVWLDNVDTLGIMRGRRLFRDRRLPGHTLQVLHPSLAACDTSTNDNDQVARRAWTVDTRRRCFLLILIPIPMPIPIALPLCLPPSSPLSLPPFSLTLIPDAPRTTFAVASFTMHGRRRWGRRGRWGWGWAQGGHKTARHAAANNAVPNRAELACVNSCGVAAASPVPRLWLSHRCQAASRRAMPPAQSIVKCIRSSRVRHARETRLPRQRARRRPVGNLLY